MPRAPATLLTCRAAREKARRGALEDRSSEAAGKAAARKDFADRRERQREVNRLQNRSRDLESRIEQLEARTESLETQIETAFGPGSDPAVADRLLAEQKSTRTELEALYAEWETVTAALDG